MAKKETDVMSDKAYKASDVFKKPNEKGQIKPINKVGGRLLAIVLRERRDAILMIISKEKDSFVYGGHMYFVSSEGTYITENLVISVYMEGVSTPLSHNQIEKEMVEREYEDAKGIIHKVKLQLIKGLKFDSALIEMILNRKMSDVFTRAHLDFPNLILLILLIAGLICGIVNIGLHFLG
jgi:hypothetical protein